MTPELPKVSEDEIHRVAQLLEVDPEKIKEKWPAFSTSTESCSKCSHKYDFYDFVKTAYDLKIHPVEYMRDFFLSDKSMEREMTTKIQCSECGNSDDTIILYRYRGPRVCS